MSHVLDRLAQRLRGERPGVQPLRVDFRSLPEVRRSPDWEAWRDLARGEPPFLAPEFFALIAPLATGRQLVACAHDGDRLTGVLPLLAHRGVLRGFMCDHTPGFDYLGSDTGLEAIWRALRGRREGQLCLANVAAASRLATGLSALAERDGCKAVVRPAGRHRAFALPGFEEKLNGHFHKNLLRCERKAGGLELERLTRPAAADFEAALAIEAAAWKAAAGTSIAADPRVGRLYRSLARLFGRRGQASLNFIRAGGARIACLFTVEDGRTLYALKVGYDPAHAAISPGHLMIWKVAADAERRGLASLDLVGRDDGWKQKWTDDAHELVDLRVYGRSARGLFYYVAREVAKPRLPDRQTPFRRGCQRTDMIGVHALGDRLQSRLARGLGVKRRLLGLVRARARSTRLGEPSRFAPGSWVRVADRDTILATLDDRSRLRGLLFVPVQWRTVGRVFRVVKHVRRIRAESGGFRPIGRTVILDGASCGGDLPEPTGCGRDCPLFFRDEWLEPAPAPHRGPSAPSRGPHARVRDASDIVSGLDLFGRRDGLGFVPEMARYAGQRFLIERQLSKVFECDRWVATRAPTYILDGVDCSGAAAGKAGPCHRGCAFLWHADWLVFEK